LVQSTTRTVRRGRRFSRFISRTASHAATLPPPSSIAPWPTSHESMWPPITTTSSGLLAADDLGHHVARRHVGQRARAHLERTHDALAAILHAVQHHGVLHAQRGRRDLRAVES
jgi:hypothetical protein